jgi:hypothetical protein
VALVTAGGVERVTIDFRSGAINFRTPLLIVVDMILTIKHAETVADGGISKLTLMLDCISAVSWFVLVSIGPRFQRRERV